MNPPAGVLSSTTPYRFVSRYMYISTYPNAAGYIRWRSQSYPSHASGDQLAASAAAQRNAVLRCSIVGYHSNASANPAHLCSTWYIRAATTEEVDHSLRGQIESSWHPFACSTMYYAGRPRPATAMQGPTSFPNPAAVGRVVGRLVCMRVQPVRVHARRRRRCNGPTAVTVVERLITNLTASDIPELSTSIS